MEAKSSGGHQMQSQVNKGGVWGGVTPPPGQNQHPSPQEKKHPPSLWPGRHTPPLFLSLGKFFHNGTVKSPWRLDFGHLLHHLWKFSPAASLQLNFLTAVHNENSYQYCGIVLEFDLGIWLPAIPVVSIGFYFLPFGFNLVALTVLSRANQNLFTSL